MIVKIIFRVKTIYLLSGRTGILKYRAIYIQRKIVLRYCESRLIVRRPSLTLATKPTVVFTLTMIFRNYHRSPRPNKPVSSMLQRVLKEVALLNRL